LKCWEIKNCPFNNTDPQKSTCPPHKNNCGCWEYDWVGFYNQMPDCEEKLQWRLAMLSNCKECEVYKYKELELDKILNDLEKS
jgi:hypothetical protein